jgi:hypothetical protein
VTYAARSQISNSRHGFEDTTGLNSRLKNDLFSAARGFRFELDIVNVEPFTKGVVSSEKGQ